MQNNGQAIGGASAALQRHTEAETPLPWPAAARGIVLLTVALWAFLGGAAWSLLT